MKKELQDIIIEGKKLPVTNKNNKFMDLNKIDLKTIKKLIGHKVWLEVFNHDEQSFEINSKFDCFCRIIKLKEIKIKNLIDDNNNEYLNRNDIIFVLEVEEFDKGKRYILLNDINGILDLNINYNKNPLNIEEFLGKAVTITNKDDEFIHAIITDYDKTIIQFAVKIFWTGENKPSLSFDLCYPINLIKNIELI